MRYLSVLILLSVSTAAVRGEPPIKLAPPKPGKLANIVAIPIPSATCVALSETAGWLAFGHDRAFPDAGVSLVRLDARGNPAAYSIPLRLPRPASATPKQPHYPLALAFHPKLPLLYVWQDVKASFSNPPPGPPAELKDFDHLLIYSVATETPELVASLCRGQSYFCGASSAGIALDDTGSFLYVPGIRDVKNPGYLRLGRFTLDEFGLPQLEDKKLDRAGRLKRLGELNATAGILPDKLTPVEYIMLFPYNPFGCGFAFQPLGKDMVIVAGWNGLIVWRPDDKQCVLSGLSFRQAGNNSLAVHPTLPTVYSTMFNTNVLYRSEQVDGYLTQIPQAWSIPEAGLFSPPVVFGKGKKLAVGGRYRVYCLDLDADGRPGAEVSEVPVLNPVARALVYSARHDRLYVTVEVSK